MAGFVRPGPDPRLIWRTGEAEGVWPTWSSGRRSGDGSGGAALDSGDQPADRLHRKTVRWALLAETPPKYVREPTASKVDPFKEWVCESAGVDPRIPSQRLREMVDELGHWRSDFCLTRREGVLPYSQEVRPLEVRPQEVRPPPL
jgi:hypothetical protein